MIKLIASDMDGTLLNDKDEIHEEFYQVFQELKKQNIIFAAASGRQYYNLAKRFEKIKDDMMFIAENGTFVVYKGEELLLNALDKETAIELIKIGRDIKESYVVLCGKKSAYIESKDERLIKEVEKYYEEYKIVNDLTKVEDDISELARDNDEFVDLESIKIAKDSELVTMLVFDDVDSIVGVDERVYGPFRPQDLVVLPKINAKIFVKNHKARFVKI